MATATPLRIGDFAQERTVHRFTVRQYERMAETGVLTAEDRVELLEGVIVDKMTQNPPHNACIDLTRAALEALLPQKWVVREQKAVRLSNSEPEPDLVVVPGPVTRYARHHPVPQDVALVIEVADASLGDDRSRKARIYARARMPVYWIINLVHSQVEVYTQPRGGRSAGYRERQVFTAAEAMPLEIEGRELGEVAVRDLLP